MFHELVHAALDADLEAAEKAWQDDKQARAALINEQKLAGLTPGLSISELVAKVTGSQLPSLEVPKPKEEEDAELPPEPEVHREPVAAFPPPPIVRR